MRSAVVNVDRQRTGLQHERELLRVAERAAAHVDLRAVVAGDAVRVLLEVDVRHRLDLVVEHDREVLRAALDVLLAAGALTGERAALRLRRVMSWKIFLPLPVNCISTTGWFDCGSMSARVPESLRSLPVISGMPLSPARRAGDA